MQVQAWILKLCNYAYQIASKADSWYDDNFLLEVTYIRFIFISVKTLVIIFYMLPYIYLTILSLVSPKILMVCYYFKLYKVLLLAYFYVFIFN